MPRKIVPLTDTQIRSYKAGDKPKTLFDGDGLFLYLPPKKYTKDGTPLPDSKLWRFKYTYEGRARIMSFGAYPGVGLAKAREKHKEAKTLLAGDIDPQAEKKRRKAAVVRERERQENTFGKVAMQWYAIAQTEWTHGHARTVLSRLQRDILPLLGSKQISEVTTRDVLDALRLVEARKAFETAHRIKTIIGQVFTFALISDIPGVNSNL